MKVKIVPCLFFLLNTFLFATYYSVSKEALGRIEPIIFSFIEMVTLLPAGICILILTRKDVSKALVKRGVLVGSWFCLAFFPSTYRQSHLVRRINLNDRNRSAHQ